MRKFNVRVNGKSYQVEVEEDVARPAAAAAPPPPRTAPPPAPAPQVAPPPVPAGGGNVTSPMPGTILAIKVKVGDTIAQGEILLILEAMKMENEIPAPVAGKIASIAVEKGAVVSSGDPLLVIE
ncbi:MAG: biotin/lipoyl-containing protein [Candidatus Erginobacter occultus]|nr:biotin/lipoyl-containing protein [Candidatus Erginobacter occultus]